MQELINAGLLGANLVPVATNKMVERYVACQIAAGLEPTALKSFSVDCKGWSPQIAEEQNNNFFLSHGIANDIAIVITPEQKGKPSYFPFSSFDRRVMDLVYSTAMRQINDLTCDTGICFDLNNGIDRYTSPADLFLINHIMVNAFTPYHLITKSRDQKELIIEYGQDDLKVLDADLRNRMFVNFQNGDFRQRNFIIEPIQYSNTRNFYSRAFGGVYVIGNMASANRMLVVRDQKLAQETKNLESNTYWLEDPDLINKLFELGLLAVDPEYYQTRLEFIDWKKDYLLANTFFKNPNKGVEYEKLTSVEKRSIAVGLGDKIPDTYFELEIYRKCIENGSPMKIGQLSPEARISLAHPPLNLKSHHRDLMWQLLTEIDKVDIYHLYKLHKEHFFRRYEKWSENKKKWAVDLLVKSRRNRHGNINYD